jgi:hypothetical protein
MNKTQAAASNNQQTIMNSSESERRRVTGGSTKGAINSATMQQIHKNAATIQITLAMWA